MVWVLWLQLTITYTCPTGMTCLEPTIQRHALSPSYQTQAACETARQALKRAYARPGETGSQGIKVVTTADLWCAQEGGTDATKP